MTTAYPRPRRDEKLLIQIDTEPLGVQYNPAKFILSKSDVLTMTNTVPVDILVAQKILCILDRSRPMGRDFLDVVFLLGKSGLNYDYLAQKTSIRSSAELKERLLSRCAQLDFGRLAKYIEPFVYSRKDADRVLMFSDFIRQEL